MSETNPDGKNSEPTLDLASYAALPIHETPINPETEARARAAFAHVDAEWPNRFAGMSASHVDMVVGYAARIADMSSDQLAELARAYDEATARATALKPNIAQHTMTDYRGILQEVGNGGGWDEARTQQYVRQQLGSLITHNLMEVKMCEELGATPGDLWYMSPEVHENVFLPAVHAATLVTHELTSSH